MEVERRGRAPRSDTVAVSAPRWRARRARRTRGERARRPVRLRASRVLRVRAGRCAAAYYSTQAQGWSLFNNFSMKKNIPSLLPTLRT